MLKKYGIYMLVFVLLGLSSLFIYQKINPTMLNENLIAGTGRMDGDLITLNTKYPGRLEQMLIQGGEDIQEGAVVAVLESEEYQAELKALDATVASAQEGLKAMEQEFGITQESIGLGIEKSKDAVEITHSQKKELEHAISSLKALVAQESHDHQRMQNLYRQQLIGQQKVELAHLKLIADADKLKALEDKKVQSGKQIAMSQNGVKLALLQKQKLIALRSNINASQKQLEALEANREKLKSVIKQLTITSPITGKVIEKISHKGEVINAGMIVATLLDPQTLYLKIFVDTMENGKIQIGDLAIIFLDSYPDKPIPAKVTQIAQNAEFTPKEVSVRSDRIQRVYAIHLQPLKIEPLLKLGIPAIGIVSINGQALPKNLNELPEL